MRIVGRAVPACLLCLSASLVLTGCNTEKTVHQPSRQALEFDDRGDWKGANADFTWENAGQQELRLKQELQPWSAKAEAKLR